MFGLIKLIPTDSNYQFMDKRTMMMYISSILIIFSILILFFKGLNLGIDFKGGTLIEIRTENKD